ncbi:MAG TPA: hypothetical protein VKK31_10720 [Thermoanaerobaculia bacterium]|nr:hypothetical protein [Thermoanaerobaculia bacterium]
METLRFARARDLPPEGEPLEGPALDPSSLVGTWVNFDAASRGIARLVIKDDGAGGMTVRTFGAGFDEPRDWGEVPGHPFSDGVALSPAVAFTALHHFGSRTVTLACYLNKCLLVVDAYTRFQDGSGRSGYFARDHFYIP